MAAYFFQFKPHFGKFREVACHKSIGFVRHASKSGTEVVATKDHGCPSLLGFKRKYGDVVKAGTVLHKDTKLNVAPGLNVGIGKIVKLFAKTPGKVIISSEKTNFDPELGVVKRSYPLFIPRYNKYINVIPEPQHKRFLYVESF